jgi:uncharacterized iron-regulated membrane protein
VTTLLPPTEVRPLRGADQKPAPGSRRATRSTDRVLRSIVFWLHLTVGAAMGIVVLVMSVTGVLLAYQRQMLDREARQHRVAAPAAGAARQPLDTLVARAAAARGQRATTLTINADPAMPVLVGLENRHTAFVDPYTGRVLGDDGRLREFFTSVERWHRSMRIGEGNRSPLGTAITGASNVGFLFLVLSGFYLWFPRRWRGHALKSVLLLNPRARGKARDWNWHHVIGFWSAPILAAVVGAAAFISYQWPMQLVNRAMGRAPVAETRPPLRGGGRQQARGDAGGAGAREGGREGAREAGRARGPRASLDTVWGRVSPRVRRWRTAQLRLPREGGATGGQAAAGARTLTIGFNGPSSAGRPDQRLTVVVNARSGAITEWQTYENADPARRLRSWVRPVHTGEAGGLVGQTLAALVSLGGAVLVWTGFALALRRLRAWLGRRARGAGRASRSGSA